MPRRRTQGTSLLELLFVVACCALITAAGAAYFRTVRQTQDLMAVRGDAFQNARVALERLSRQMRQTTTVAAISAPDEPDGSITATDAEGTDHVFALVGTELRYGIDSADSLLAVGIESLTFQGYDESGAAETEPSRIRAVRVVLTASLGASGGAIDLSARVRLRKLTAPAGTIRTSTTYATAYETTGSRQIADYWKAFGAPNGDNCHKHPDEAGMFYGFQPGAYSGTVHRIYLGAYMKCKNKDKPLSVTIRHGTATLLDRTFDTTDLTPIENQWVWQWFDITDGRAEWTDADISALSIELSGIGDVEAQCFAVRAVFDPTEIATWWADREGSGSCPNEWTYGGNALGAPNSTYARASFGEDKLYQSYRVTVPDSDATILTVEVCVYGGPSWWLYDGTLNVNVALPGAGKDSGRRHTLDDDVLEAFVPYSTNGGAILTDVSPDVDWTWAALNGYEIRLLTREDDEYEWTRLYADAVGWRIRYAVPQRGIIRWEE